MRIVSIEATDLFSFDELSLEELPPQALVVVGPNGAGKTNMSRLVEIVIAAVERSATFSTKSYTRLVQFARGINSERLFSASVVREHLGRISDVIHAAAIALALPHLLDPDERLGHPLLAAGNDPSRPYDVETNLRVAEFKLGPPVRRRRSDCSTATASVGEDPRFIVRRMVILASEDIGNADPQALTMATATAAAVEQLGMPEAQFAP